MNLIVACTNRARIVCRYAITAVAMLVISVPSVFAQSSDLSWLEVQNIAYVEVKGVVQDGRTSLPIAGVRVLALWEATSYGWHSSIRHCLKIAAGKTDAQGRFSITAPVGDVFRRGLAQQYVDIRIHKAGWQEQPQDTSEDGRTQAMKDEKRISLAALSQGGMLTMRHILLNARLFPSKQDSHERLRALRLITKRPYDCETEGARPAILGFFNAVASEASDIARTKYERTLATVLSERALKVGQPGHQVDESKIMETMYSTSESGDFDRRDRQDRTPLMRAAETRDLYQVKHLLAQGANPNRTRSGHGLLAGDSALTLAIRDKSVTVVAALLRHPSTDPNLRNRPKDYTPLMKALELGQDKIVQLLLKAGADPNLTAYGKRFSALRISADRAATGQNSAGVSMRGAMNQFRILLASKKVDLNMPTTYDGQTALTAAASSGRLLIVKQLLEAGADPNARDLRGRTPLYAITDSAERNPNRPKYAETLLFITAWPGARL